MTFEQTKQQIYSEIHTYSKINQTIVSFNSARKHHVGTSLLLNYVFKSM